ncbi:MAG TPA: DNA primase [Acetobacteraceae bacterium]|jgi:DNA primase|nr:DNA primase [Acetobacteraceae bacterium]
MALPASFLDELRARTPLAGVVGRRVKLARSGRQMKGCCPFHQEKTPSFYVYEDGYHCFGCGAHGDAISFVMQSEGAGFMEAVERLAAEAGIEVPKPSPEAAEAERKRHDLNSVLEAAQAGYHRRLFLPEGRHALAYLLGRGLTEQTIRRFGLGWSGEGRGALLADLGRDGITEEQLVDAGLMRRDDETGRAFDLFFNRVMFPIRDRRGRAISFGGRTLGDGQPKYVNGPETALFSKRRTLYALDLAREAVRGGASLVVVEGYMDVIALAQAGMGGAVAPLGTALTEEQLEELWRLAPAPILCFDGDAAGSRAAARAAELALPLLAPDRTLKLAKLPAGEDPDTLVRRQGADGIRTVLDAATPLADALYDLLREASGDATPEQRAAFLTRLDQAAGRISDKALAGEYREALRGRFYAARRRGRGARFGGPATAPLRAAPRPQPAGGIVATERARILTAILLRHPAIWHDVEHAYAGLDLPRPFDTLRTALRDWIETADVLDSQALMSHLTLSGLNAEADQALATVPVPLPACAALAAMPAEAEAGWWHIFGFLNVQRLGEEVALAEAACAQDLTQQSQNRLVALKAALNKVKSGEPDGVDLAA